MTDATPPTPPPPPPPPPPDEEETPRQLVGRFLLFLGPIVALGGALAILRTGERSVFFALFLPIGMLIWLAGVILRRHREQ